MREGDGRRNAGAEAFGDRKNWLPWTKMGRRNGAAPETLRQKWAELWDQAVDKILADKLHRNGYLFCLKICQFG